MPSPDKMRFPAVVAEQSEDHKVVTIAARANEILRFASIDRINRDDQGELSGFQRPQVAAHIREIQDYLEKPNSVLPNAIVIAFIEGVELEDAGDGIGHLSIDVSKGPTGLVVDGQQRLTALSSVERDFQVFVSVLICNDEAELRRQFVLINNSKPLPKSLIYELLPTVDDLPSRLSKRSTAADLTARLNFDKNSSLREKIKQHTCPDGVIADTVIQKLLMDSLSDGILRELIRQKNGETKCVHLVSEFFEAVKRVFPEDWYMHTPKTSRLMHGAGIQALGDVMEILASRLGAKTATEFAEGLKCLVGKTAWTSGEWEFGGEVRKWNSLQNVNRDVALLKHYLVGVVKADLRSKRRAEPVPLFEDTAAN